MNVACDYEAPMQMLTTEKYIASRHRVAAVGLKLSNNTLKNYDFCKYVKVGVIS